MLYPEVVSGLEEVVNSDKMKFLMNEINSVFSDKPGTQTIV